MLWIVAGRGRWGGDIILAVAVGVVSELSGRYGLIDCESVEVAVGDLFLVVVVGRAVSGNGRASREITSWNLADGGGVWNGYGDSGRHRP